MVIDFYPRRTNSSSVLWLSLAPVFFDISFFQVKKAFLSGIPFRIFVAWKVVISVAGLRRRSWVLM